MSDILKYIDESWEKCLRHNPEDDGTLIGMPYPYTVPAINHFNEIYYWDTYFANKGLFVSNKWELAKNNTDNMLYLVNKYGFMPNGNRLHYLGNSQPPFLSMMVRDIYEHYKDNVWLLGAFETLKIEYRFWMEKRLTPDGLNKYNPPVDEDAVERKAKYFAERVSGDYSEYSPRQIAEHSYALCESGWDMCPRFEYECQNYAPIDLNSLMFAFEENMSFFARELGYNEEALWIERAELRKQRIASLLQKDGVLTDYNYNKKKHCEIFSCAPFYAMYVGLASKEQADAIFKNLGRLEFEYGLVACEKNSYTENFQWSYPMGWACLQYIVVLALDRYGYIEDAKRIANKYVCLVEKVFEETGNFWEKYNVVEGNINVTRKDNLPIMIGWTAGAYSALKKYLEE